MNLTLSDLFKKYKDPLPGGEGDSLTPDLVPKAQLIVGIYVELEHTNDVMIATSIALDHLSVNKDYYTILYNAGLIDEKKAVEAAKKYFKDMSTGYNFVQPTNKWDDTKF